MSYLDMINFNEYTLLEGQQAEEYKDKKAKEKYNTKAANEDKYRHRYGEKFNRTILGSEYIKPNTSNADYTTGTVNNLNVRNSSKLTADQKQNHYDKMEDNNKKAHIAAAKEANKREFNKFWNSGSNNDALKRE